MGDRGDADCPTCPSPRPRRAGNRNGTGTRRYGELKPALAATTRPVRFPAEAAGTGLLGQTKGCLKRTLNRRQRRPGKIGGIGRSIADDGLVAQSTRFPDAFAIIHCVGLSRADPRVRWRHEPLASPRKVPKHQVWDPPHSDDRACTFMGTPQRARRCLIEMRWRATYLTHSRATKCRGVVTYLTRSRYVFRRRET